MSFIKPRKDGKNPNAPRGAKKTAKKSAKKKSARKRKPKPKIDVSVPVGPDKKEQARWMAEEDLRTLQRAREIKSDSKRVKNARVYAQEQMDALKKAIED